MDTLTSIFLLVVVVGVMVLVTRIYFRSDAEQERRKKAADEQDELLNKALRDANLAGYRRLLDPEVTRFLPRLPYRTDGAKLVGDLMEDQLGSADGPPESVYSKKVQSYENSILITYTFLMKGKDGDKPVEYTGKTTRLWTRSRGGRWYLAHEHVSFNR